MLLIKMIKVSARENDVRFKNCVTTPHMMSFQNGFSFCCSFNRISIQRYTFVVPFLVGIMPKFWAPAVDVGGG